ncbi:unnamed protein product [Prorocentrum cordatum]|uniref:Selenoprotein O n=1 Tax=Prorocentrum cordatum TaxID=2364126 RepID=A0ABN9SSR9_9DINO|nr:unnamed protein product [Polarella glacialis]
MAPTGVSLDQSEHPRVVVQFWRQGVEPRDLELLCLHSTGGHWTSFQYICRSVGAGSSSEHFFGGGLETVLNTGERSRGHPACIKSFLPRAYLTNRRRLAGFIACVANHVRVCHWCTRAQRAD